MKRKDRQLAKDGDFRTFDAEGRVRNATFCTMETSDDANRSVLVFRYYADRADDDAFVMRSAMYLRGNDDCMLYPVPEDLRALAERMTQRIDEDYKEDGEALVVLPLTEPLRLAVPIEEVAERRYRHSVRSKRFYRVFEWVFPDGEEQPWSRYILFVALTFSFGLYVFGNTLLERGLVIAGRFAAAPLAPRTFLLIALPLVALGVIGSRTERRTFAAVSVALIPFGAYWLWMLMWAFPFLGMLCCVGVLAAVLVTLVIELRERKKTPERSAWVILERVRAVLFYSLVMIMGVSMVIDILHAR